MHTIIFFDGSSRHVRDDQAQALMEDKVSGKAHIIIDGSLITLSSVSRVDPSEVWLADQRERLMATEYEVCEYGHKHHRTDTCDCLEQFRVPLLLDEADKLLKHIEKCQKDNNLSDFGEDMIARGYPQKLLTCFPNLRSAHLPPPLHPTPDV